MDKRVTDIARLNTGTIRKNVPEKGKRTPPCQRTEQIPNKELHVDISPNELTITDKYGYSITAEQYLRPSTGEQRIRLDVANYTGDDMYDSTESLLDIPSSDFDRLIEYLRELVRN